MRRVYVVGVGVSRVDRRFSDSLRSLFAEASLKALDDAGNPSVDAVVVANMMSSRLQEQDSLASLLADSIGLRGRMGFKVETACGSGGSAIIAGYSLVASGLANVVLVGGVEKMSDYPTKTVTRALAQAADAEYELFYGASFAGLNALVTRMYMMKYNVKHEVMAEWPVLMHENGYMNPYAQLRFKVTVEDVLKSPVIADPVRLLDCSPLGDGAAAVVLASEDYARRLNDAPVEIAGLWQATDCLDLASREEIIGLKATRIACEKAYRMARVDARDVDVVELHDAFTIMGLLSLEEMGFAPRGEAAKLVAEGRFRVGDKPQVNLSGGLKARGHPVGATGVYQAAEIVMQLRGDFPGLKASKAEVGVTENIGGTGASVSIIVFRR